MKISPKQKKVIIPNLEGCLIEVESVDYYLESYERGKYEITIENLIYEASLRGVDMSHLKELVKRKEAIFELVTLSKFDNVYFPLLGVFLALNNTKQVLEILAYHLKLSNETKRFVLCVESIVMDNLKISPLGVDSTTINLIIDWVEENKIIISKESELEIDKLDADDRIHTYVPKETIEDYFSLLTKVKGNIHPNLPILSEIDVKNLLKANFHTFDPRVEKKLFKLNHSNKSVIRFFIYHYYRNIDYEASRNNQKKYCQLLIDNFECYQNNTIESISKNFSKKPSKYPISNSN